MDSQSSNMDVDSQLSQRKTTDLRAHMGEIEKLTQEGHGATAIARQKGWNVRGNPSTEIPEHHSKLSLRLPIYRALKNGEM